MVTHQLSTKKDSFGESFTLSVRPIYWSIPNHDINIIEIFGYTSDGQTIYIKIPRKSTFILKFPECIDDNIIRNITEIFHPTYIKVSNLDPHILIIRTSIPINYNKEHIPTWIDIKQDPYSELESLWQLLDIGPYEWISIKKFTPLPGKYTECNLNIQLDENNISIIPDKLSFIPVRLLFWNIDKIHDQKGFHPFQSEKRSLFDQNIEAISIITVYNDNVNKYIIETNDAYSNKIESNENFVILRASNERDLIMKFFAMYSTFKPDRQICYNGDTVTIPYFLGRLMLHNIEIPKISKILSVTPDIMIRKYRNIFETQTSRTLNFPGTESIDLKYVKKRFYLDTNINHKKSENIVTELYETWINNDIQEILESVCNNLGINVDTILHEEWIHIVDRAMYNIDPGSVMNKGHSINPSHIRIAKFGIYQNVYVYDYAELYRQLMLMSEQNEIITLADRLEGAPSKLIMTAFYSKYVDRTHLVPLLNNALDILLTSNKIIAIEPYIIRSIDPLKAKWLVELDSSLCYVSISQTDSIIINNDKSMKMNGFKDICRPKFKLAKDAIKQYLLMISNSDSKHFQELEDLSIDGKVFKFSIDQEIIPFEKLVIHDRSSSMKYIMTVQGRILTSNYQKDDKSLIIDYNYYTTEINRYLTEFQSFKIYGIPNV